MANNYDQDSYDFDKEFCYCPKCKKGFGVRKNEIGTATCSSCNVILKIEVLAQ